MEKEEDFVYVIDIILNIDYPRLKYPLRRWYERWYSEENCCAGDVLQKIMKFKSATRVKKFMYFMPEGHWAQFHCEGLYDDFIYCPHTREACFVESLKTRNLDIIKMIGNDAWS